MTRLTNSRINFFAGLAVILFFGFAGLFLAEQSLVATVKSDLGRSVDFAGTGISSSKLDKLTLSDQDNSIPEYIDMRRQFLNMEEIVNQSNLIGVYVMKVVGNEVIFVVDSAPTDDPWHSEPGVVYEEPSPVIFDVQNGAPSQFVGPYTDEYGSFYSIFSAVKDDDGSVIAVIGADIEVQTYNQLLTQRRLLPLVIFFFTLTIYVAGYIVITTRKRRTFDNELRSTMLKNINEGVVATNSEGLVTFANTYSCQSIGVSEKACMGKDFHELFAVTDEKGKPLSNAKQPFTLLMRGKKSEIPNKGYYFLKRADGTVFPVITTMSTVLGSGGDASYIVTFRDFTKEAEIDKMKSDFISIATHQIKTPLTALRWISESLIEGKSKLPPDAQVALGQLQQVINHLNDLVQSLLNITRIETGRLIVEPKMTDLNAIMNEVVTDVSARTAAKHQTVHVEVDKNLSKVKLDPGLLRELYKNLLTNAVKYSPDGENIIVRIERRGNEMVTLVKDNGYGIPKKDHARVFTKFYRGDNIVALSEDGTGLGLYFAKQVAEALGGKLWFESDEGKGTEFFFSIPLKGSKAHKGTVKIG